MYLAEMAGAVYDHGVVDRDRILIMCSSEEVLAEAMGSIYPKIGRCFR